MTIEKLKQLNSCVAKIQKLKGLIEVGESETLTDERFLSELFKNDEILSEARKFAIQLAKSQLLEYEKEFEKL